MDPARPPRGQIALVTDAARGVGTENARQLGASGATVLVGARHEARARAMADRLIAEGIEARGLRLDVPSAEDRAAVRDRIADEHGVLDILVNNAGVWLESPNGSEPPPNRTSTLSPELLRQTFETNFFGPVHLAHELRDTPIKVNSVHPGWVRTEMGGASARLDLAEGSRTVVQLSCLPDDGPTGKFFFEDKQLPW